MEVSNNAYVCWGVDIGYITTILDFGTVVQQQQVSIN
jgi:hypothetical protein